MASQSDAVGERWHLKPAIELLILESSAGDMAIFRIALAPTKMRGTFEPNNFLLYKKEKRMAGVPKSQLHSRYSMGGFQWV
jgi:hypothetical protein